MTFKHTLIYILRHAWFWLPEFYLRPLTVIDRIKENEIPELISAMISGGLWGALIGTVLWLMYGDFFNFFPIFAIAVAGMGTVAMVVVWTFVFIGAVVFAIMFVEAIAFTVVGSEAVVFAVALAGTLTGAFVKMFARAVAYLFIVFYVGIILGLLLDSTEFFSLTLILFIALISLDETIVATIWLLGFPIIGFAFFPHSTIEQTSMWGIVLVLSLGVGMVAGFFDDSYGLWKIKADSNFVKKKASQINFLSSFYSLFLILALAAWFPSPDTAGLNQKLDKLAIFLAIAPFLWTGLFLYPFTALIALWQFRNNRVKTFTVDNLQLTAPFRWQTFAYPLPKLRYYLFLLGKQQDASTAFNAIQQVQLWTLQMRASRQAAHDLASHPETALAFCGEMVIQTNASTTFQLAITGNMGRAVAIFAVPKKDSEKDEQPLRLWIGDLPQEKIREINLFGKNVKKIPPPDWLKGFNTVQNAVLSKRIEYALNQLADCQHYKNINDFQLFLKTLLRFSEIKNIGTILAIAETPPVIPEKFPEWIQGGWSIIEILQKSLDRFTDYRNLQSQEARRDFLKNFHKRINEIKLDSLPEYWQNIGTELIAHWIKIIDNEIEQARELLHLTIDLTTDNLILGRQLLNFRLHNPTHLIAEKLHITVQETEGVFWCISETRHSLLEGKDSTDLHLELQTDTAGIYIIRGQLTAQDLDGNVFKQPFDFQITVAHAGKPYQIPDYQPYIVGEGLGDDRTFVGRTDLIHWLSSLWRQPQGKPTVVLIGQRRIGKTSLLHKIKRAGLDGTNLVPIFINIQDMSSEYDFLKTTSKMMAESLNIDKPLIDKQESYVDFKDFLETAEKSLAGRRFLLMLDEADLITAKRLGDLLPDFLRSLMQQANYPTVLLFCGTYALKRSAWDYASILFNTAQFKTVSYLSAAESAEVLQKPTKNILEFNDFVLEQAYKLTRGQPLLLQSLGAIIIEEFNAAVRADKKRNNYVNFKDLEQATQKLVQEQDNAAFIEHWTKCDTAIHRVLSSLAWATDEINRPQLDIDGILSAMTENRLALPRKQVFDIIQNLVDEEILESAGLTYRFAVPLYRRWIAWRWPTTKVREEG